MIRKHANAGHPFLVDNNREDISDYLVDAVRLLQADGVDEDDITIHITAESYEIINNWDYSTVQRLTGKLGLFYGVAVYPVDDESKQGVFATLQPFYRFKVATLDGDIEAFVTRALTENIERNGTGRQ